MEVDIMSEAIERNFELKRYYVKPIETEENEEKPQDEEKKKKKSFWELFSRYSLFVGFPL